LFDSLVTLCLFAHNGLSIIIVKLSPSDYLTDIWAGRTSSSPNAIKAPVKSTGTGASVLSFTRFKDKNTVPDSLATTAPSADMSLPMSVSSSVISHDEIISALHGLLQRAGMPISMDTKVYIQVTLFSFSNYNYLSIGFYEQDIGIGIEEQEGRGRTPSRAVRHVHRLCFVA
jgi:hypothetical protein